MAYVPSRFSDPYAITVREIQSTAVRESIISHDIKPPPRTKEAALERRIKEGCSGVELLDYVTEIFECDEPKALEIIKATITKSAKTISTIFSTDQVTMMAFNLYETAMRRGRTREAADVLASITRLMRDKVRIEEDWKKIHAMNAMEQEQIEKRNAAQIAKKLAFNEADVGKAKLIKELKPVYIEKEPETKPVETMLIKVLEYNPVSSLHISDSEDDYAETSITE